MKSSTAVVVVAIVLAATVAAANSEPQRRNRIIIRPQVPNAPGPRGRCVDVDYPTPEKRAANLAELLTLTDEQRQKVRDIFVEQDSRTSEVWADESLAAEALEKKIAGVRDEIRKKIRQILTDDQRKQYDALTPEKPAERIRLQPDPRG